MFGKGRERGEKVSGIEEHDLRLLLESEMWNTEGTACPSFPIIVSKHNQIC